MQPTRSVHYGLSGSLGGGRFFRRFPGGSIGCGLLRGEFFLTRGDSALALEQPHLALNSFERLFLFARRANFGFLLLQLPDRLFDLRKFHVIPPFTVGFLVTYFPAKPKWPYRTSQKPQPRGS